MTGNSTTEMERTIDNAPSIRTDKEGEQFKEACNYIRAKYGEDGSIYAMLTAAYEFGRATGIKIGHQEANKKEGKKWEL